MRANPSDDVVLGSPLPQSIPCTADGLNAKFARPDAVHFECLGAIGTGVRLTAPGGTVLVALRGAQVLEWVPAGSKANRLWVSEASTWSEDRPVRGGIPVCWPWFGPNTSATDAPQHGVARTSVWQVYTTCASATEARVCFKLKDPSQYHASVPAGAEVMIEIVVAETLRVTLTTINTGDRPFDLTQALHTYFAVKDISQTRILGLERATYFDQVAIASRPAERKSLAVEGEVDRVYQDVTAPVRVRDDVSGLTTKIEKSGSRATVVWNPWQDKSSGFADMAADDFRRMVCVETANVGADVISVKPGHIHTLVQTLSVA